MKNKSINLFHYNFYFSKLSLQYKKWNPGKFEIQKIYQSSGQIKVFKAATRQWKEKNLSFKKSFRV